VIDGVMLKQGSKNPNGYARAALKPFSMNLKLSISWAGLSIPGRIVKMRNSMIDAKTTGVNSNLFSNWYNKFALRKPGYKTLPSDPR